MPDIPTYAPFALEKSQAMAALGAVRFTLTMAEGNIYAPMPEMHAKIESLRETEIAMVDSIRRAGFEVAS